MNNNTTLASSKKHLHIDACEEWEAALLSSSLDCGESSLAVWSTIFSNTTENTTTMCVTNTTYRRSQPIALPQQQAATQPTGETCGAPSNLTQRLMGTFQLSAPAKPQGGFVQQPVSCAQPLHLNGDKPRPKRRRKPQKPGKTAKMNDRHFVIHNYHDHAMDSEEDFGDDHHEEEHSRRKGGVAVAFPLKLHAILDQVERDGLAHVISWQSHGRCFLIHQPKEFVNHVMPK